MIIYLAFACFNFNNSSARHIGQLLAARLVDLYVALADYLSKMAFSVKTAVDKATSELLLMPDWDTNLQVRHNTSNACAASAT